MKMFIMSILVATFVIAAICLIPPEPQSSPAPVKASTHSDQKPKPEINLGVLNSLPLKLPLVEPKIIVLKSKRQLLLYSDGKVVRTYRVGLGFNPVDDKVKEGDGATPEGELYVFIKNPKSAYYLSLGISYPSIEDAERGLRAGLITRAQYKQIVSAIQRKVAPPQNTRLGGQIYIHGNGSDRDWTWGCIALEDKDMKELFDAIVVGTSVIIEH